MCYVSDGAARCEVSSISRRDVKWGGPSFVTKSLFNMRTFLMRNSSRHFASCVIRGIYCTSLVICIFLSSCADNEKQGFEQKLYFDAQGNITDAYVEGGIQIEYDKNDLSKFVVSHSTLTTYTHLLFTLKEQTISSVRITTKRFIDSKGNISYDSPAEEKTQMIDFESTEQDDDNYKKIGCDALKAIIHSMTKNG